MNLYSEIYGAYYNIIAELLRRVSFTDEELREVVQRKGFGETMLYLIPKIESGSIALFEKDGELYVFARFWLPAEKIDEAEQRDGVPYRIFIQRGLLFPSGDNFVDYNDCLQWFRQLVEEYQIYPLKVGYDRYSADYLTQQMKQYGFHMDDVYQGDNLFGVIQEVQGILEDGKIHIGDNDLLKMHLLNSAIKMSTERGRGKLVKLNPSLHIDGTAALIDGMCVRQKYYADIGSQLKNEE
jgi:phage terminase large subunit-like protein